jgi:hypothetical protein
MRLPFGVSCADGKLRVPPGIGGLAAQVGRFLLGPETQTLELSPAQLIAPRRGCCTDHGAPSGVEPETS